MKALIVFSWLCLIGTAAIAGEEYRTKIAIDIDDEASGHQSFKFDSSELEAAGAHQAHKRREVRVIKKKEDATD